MAARWCAAAKVRASEAAKSLDPQIKEQIANEAPVDDDAPTTEEKLEALSTKLDHMDGDRLRALYLKIMNETGDGKNLDDMRSKILEAGRATDGVIDLSDGASGQGATKAPKEPKAPKERDARLPPVGTVLVKKDRDGTERARCTIVENGVEYKGEVYKSLSAAGLKAMTDLNLAAKTCDGFAFWGLKKKESAPRPAKAVSLEPLQKAWERYIERARAAKLVKGDEARAKVDTMLADHLEALQTLVEVPANAEVAQ